MKLLIFADHDAELKVAAFLTADQGGEIQQQHLAMFSLPLPVRPVAVEHQAHEPGDFVTVHAGRGWIHPAAAGGEGGRDGHRVRQAGGTETGLQIGRFSGGDGLRPKRV